jgi:hypothetical protein
MLIHSAVITGSVQFNNTDVSGITNVSSFATTASVDAVVVKTGSFATTSSVNELQSKTGSYTSTSSFGAYSSSINTFTSSATTRLNTIESVTGSFASTSSVNNLQSVTGSFATTSSFTSYTSSNDGKVNAVIAKTGSFATTGSNAFTGSQTITGSLTATGTITAQTLVVQTITSSVEYSSGSNIFGSLSSNTHQFTGSVLMSGSVGIGTSSPIALLTVAQVTANMTASRSQIAITTGGNYGNVIGSGAEKYLDLSFYGYTNAEVARIRSWDESNVTTNGTLTFWTLPAGGSVTERMRITSTGNVGIGTSSPNFNSYGTALTLLSSLNYGGIEVYGSGSTKGGQIDFGSGNVRYASISGEYESSDNGFIQIRTRRAGTMTDAIRITASGSVGIGTTNPSGSLHIVGTNATNRGQLSIQSNNASNAARVSFYYDTTLQGNIGTTSGDFYGESINNYLFYAGGSERMRISSDGNVGIGVSPLTKLHVLGGNVAALFTGNTGAINGYSGIVISARDAQDSNGQYGVEIRATNTQGTPSYLNPKMELLVQNNSSYLAADRTVKMTITGAGSIGAPSGTNIYNASDIRLKQNVSTITYGLNTISLLNPIKFNWVDGFESTEDGKDMLGFVAQEVQTIIPEAVESFGGDINLNGTTIDNPLRVNEKFIIPILVKAIQELKAEIDILKQQ